MARLRGSRDQRPRKRRTKAEIELAAILPPDADIEMPLYGLRRRIAGADPDVDEKYRDTLRIAVLPYLHPKATPRPVAKPYFLMSDQELAQVRALEIEHERQIALGRAKLHVITKD